MKKLLLSLAAALTAAIVAAGEIELVKATYGTGDRFADVTGAVRKNAVSIPGVLLAIPADNRLLGTDPAPHSCKRLTLIGKVDGREKRAVAVERQTCLLLAKDDPPSREFRLIGAYYGFGDRWNDVTEKLRSACVDVKVDNFNFGPDPASGKSKSLVVLYSRNHTFGIHRLKEREIYYRNFHQQQR